MERFLRLKVDGRQSAVDCRAIRAYQRSQIIEPANGYAGPITRNALYWEWAIYHTKELRGCPKRKGRVVCVELTHQILWVRQGGKVVAGPFPVRSGRAGYPTRTGWFRIGTRNKDHWSTLYDSPMPFAQFFSGGQALHGIYGNLYKEPASYGCVNLRYETAEFLWKKLRKGDRVYVWGRRPGT
ncbi:L,D-transpeptidase family protein [Streptomyces niveiscabiei]|uniref:L,D-transpeptidase n=1 Tax=Streptomyces niveiscabiei TaxID=164115 RepID=UPI0029B68DEC|nr:L,D-transpeptidase family protein [Streptomyces niveiscabiei]MDX3386053.1 L,D-transpeptidase family protein [Streptomyces niveiscabiei]